MIVLTKINDSFIKLRFSCCKQPSKFKIDRNNIYACLLEQNAALHFVFIQVEEDSYQVIVHIFGRKFINMKHGFRSNNNNLTTNASS